MIEQQTTFCYFGEYHSCWQNLHNFRASVVEGTLIRQKLQECILKSKTNAFLPFKMAPLGFFFLFLLTVILDDYPFLKIKIVCFDCHITLLTLFFGQASYLVFHSWVGFSLTY
jgi:hypothetical protein